MQAETAIPRWQASCGTIRWMCGGIGQGAKDALGSCGIQIVPGTVGSVDQVVRDYLDGVLVGNFDFTCSHHEHDHAHGDHHCCGEHGCGSHS